MLNNVRELVLKQGRSATLRITLGVQLLMILFLLGAGAFLSYKHRQSLIESSHLSLDHHLYEASMRVQHYLVTAENSARELRQECAGLFDHLHSVGQTDWQEAKSDYGYAPNGVFYLKRNRGGASLYYSRQSLSEEQLHKAVESEVIDHGLARAVQTNPLVVGSYLNTWDGMNRYYPFLPDVYEIFPPEVYMEDFIFYSAAMEEANPARDIVWTNAYLDPAGAGWMISCVVPIYHNDFLEGVIGLDLPLEALTGQVLNLDLPWKSHSMLLASENRIVSFSTQLRAGLGLESFDSHKEDGPIDHTIEPPLGVELERYSLPLAEALRQMDRTSGILFEMQGEEYLLEARDIPGTNFTMLLMAAKDELLEPIVELDHTTLTTGGLLLLLLFLLDLGLYFWLSRKSIALADDLATPLTGLNKAISRFREHQERTLLAESSITEIERLRQNFDEMIDQVLTSRRSITRLNYAYSRFVPQSFLKHLGKRNVLDIHPGDFVERPFALLYANMHNYRFPSHRLDAKNTFAYINNWMNRIGPELRAKGGFIDHFTGDSILVLFEQADDALESARMLHRQLEFMNRESQEKGLPRVRMGIGLHFGDVMLGAVGDADRIEAGVLGPAVRQVISIEELSKIRGTRILLSEAFRLALRQPEGWQLHSLPPMTLHEEREGAMIHSLEEDGLS
jgi:class 3 adenylate cyclase